LAASLKLSQPDLAAALESETFTPRVKHDFLGGVRSGVNGTPTFFINNARLDGPWEYEDLVTAIDAAISAAK
jgi:protein-disulfide isomerase